MHGRLKFIFKGSEKFWFLAKIVYNMEGATGMCMFVYLYHHFSINVNALVIIII